MKENNYYEQREINCIERLNTIIEELPYFVQDFFVGVELRTSALTRLNYGYDLRVFFDFLIKKVFRNKKMEDIILSDLSKLEASDFEYFLSYLSHYTINNKEERCTETGKARKLSAIKSLFAYLYNNNLLALGFSISYMFLLGIFIAIINSHKCYYKQFHLCYFYKYKVHKLRTV